MTEHRKTGITELSLACCDGALANDETLLSTAAGLDSLGFWSIECANSRMFETCIGRMIADPWERIRRLRKAMPSTRLQISMHGQSLLGRRFFADDVLDAFVAATVDCGVEVFRIFDALGDIRNMSRAIGAIKAAGKHAQGAIVYTISPLHNNERFINIAIELEKMGCDSICLLDHAGLINPTDAFNLIAGLKANVRTPISLSLGTNSGMADATLLKAVEAGCDVVDASARSLAHHTAFPSTEAVVKMLSKTPFDTGIGLDLLSNAISGVQRKIAEEHPAGGLAFDPRSLTLNIPGDMIAEIEDQLREQGAIERLDDVLREIVTIRNELGQAPLVAPTSQIIGTQAVLNVLHGGRYKTITSETKALVAGRYGRTPAPIDDVICSMALAGEKPIDARPADLIEPELAHLQQALGTKPRPKEDTLTYAFFPALAPAFFKTKDADALGFSTTGTKAQETGTYNIIVDGISFDVVVKNAYTHGAAEKFTHATHLATEGISEDNGITVVSAPFAGKVLRIDKRDGATATAGETVMIVESMNMETAVKTSEAGRIYRQFVTEGAAFQQGQPLYAIRR